MKQNHNTLPLSACLAKTYTSENVKCAGRTVLEHCLIVGIISRALVQRMPKWLDFLFPHGSELIAAAHDVGKISPTFQKKIHISFSDYALNFFPELKNANPILEKKWGYHAGVSQISVKACTPGKYIPEILGQHHGYSPNVSSYRANDEVFGGERWQRCREELITELKCQLKCDWPKVNSPLHSRVLAGLTTVADWVGSGSMFDIPTQEWRLNVELALDNAGFIKPKLRNNLSFSEIFGFELREIQAQLIKCCTSPGLYILEAPMGIGKTEAALYAAYAIMASEKAAGIYFALPTQLTSNKIYDRMNQFLEQILQIDCPHRKALLLHSNALLHMTEIGEDGNPGGSWFQSSKRALLAPFAVGTIDQALMSVMNVKHGFVRTFGLAGKVVILDEVHSYDAYTGTILNKLAEALVELHCTVIILSATLTNERRQELLAPSSTSQGTPLSNHYPLISAAPKNKVFHEVSIPSLESEEVAIKMCHEDTQALEEALFRADQGQYILWIENTVDEAQAVFKILAARCKDMNLTCGLLHSRFLKHDRNNHEKLWISLFSKARNSKRRIQGCILIGTQVLEQSIDIDADFIITRICPTDMLLQRLGRLWRHKETKRSEYAVREALILSPVWDEAIRADEKAFGKTALIYSPYVLYRTMEVWHKLHSITLPDFIRPLVEDTYSERDEVGKMSLEKERLKRKKADLERFASIGISQGGTTLSEDKASTRYSEVDSVDVLLLRSFLHNNTGTTLTFLNGDQMHLPKNCRSQKNREWRKKATTLQNNTVKVATYLAPIALPIQDLAWLKDYLYLGNEEYGESLLRLAKVSDSGELTSSPSDYKLQYDSMLGYQARKKR